MRVLSTLWVVIGHTWIFGAYTSSLNNYNVREVSENPNTNL